MTTIRTLTRRQFLHTAAGVAAALELSRCVDWPFELIPTAHAVGWPTVSVAQGTNEDSAAAILKTALDGLGGIERFVKPGQTVAIKPNATWAYPPFTASSTDPDLLRALILIVRQAGAKRIIVMDHCSIDPGTAECLRESGIGQVVDELRVDKVFPDRYLSPKELYTQIELPKGKAFQKLGVIKAAVEADVRINMALAKSHVVTKLTMTLKHMMGFLELPNQLHTQLEQGIADLSSPSPVQAQLHILEAIRVRLPVGATRQAGGNETDITHPDKIKRLNQVVAGTDPVLMDAYGCVNYFSIKPQELTHVKRAWESGLGEIDVDKATQEERLRVYTVGQSLFTPTPTPTRPPVTTSPTATGVLPTNTPMPTATAGPIEASAQRPCTNTSDVINPAPFLSGALIPAAAIVTGVGLVVRRRMERQSEERKDDK
jgi:uncharacterized protein (DUF362 family)